MSEPKILANGAYAVFDGMTWPLPGERMGEVEWQMRYGEPDKQDRMLAASIIAAYRQMVGDTSEKRAAVVRALRKAEADYARREVAAILASSAAPDNGGWPVARRHTTSPEKPTKKKAEIPRRKRR